MGSNYSAEPDAVQAVGNDVDLMKMRSLNSKLVSGAALMLALWALFLLSAMVISWALDIDSRLALSGNANRVLAAEAMAASGTEVALHPSVAPSSPNLHRKMGDRESYDVGVTGEGGRLNLNWLTAGEDPTRLGILRRYLELKGIEMNDRDTMIDSLLDWVSPNTGLHHLNAPPESDDYHPAACAPGFCGRTQESLWVGGVHFEAGLGRGFYHQQFRSNRPRLGLARCFTRFARYERRFG